MFFNRLLMRGFQRDSFGPPSSNRRPPASPTGQEFVFEAFRRRIQIAQKWPLAFAPGAGGQIVCYAEPALRD